MDAARRGTFRKDRVNLSLGKSEKTNTDPTGSHKSDLNGLPELGTCLIVQLKSIEMHKYKKNRKC
ncbi:hypothetical protein FOXB_02219 [Fusarium oxysporum f. sp. conglutinans Fo5176]|uniref:Uncharacterized protein n=1 Tax=Fusarium oxysporum (strain Fo5176) TaxID=660025 RepID=F9F744_FUSOF|nr:hypothetical protein FOXB_02219 [Fusarium oxysporum f. sp. conglutinans Fo5176]